MPDGAGRKITKLRKQKKTGNLKPQKSARCLGCIIMQSAIHVHVESS